MARGRKQPAVSLLELPEACLHRILSFLDGPSTMLFFRASKGSREQPGCASLVLTASNKVSVSKTINSRTLTKTKSAQAFRRLLFWASSLNPELAVRIECGGQPLKTVLASLMRFKHTELVPYLNVTSLSFTEFTSTHLIPQEMTDAFPNLKRLELSNFWIYRDHLEHGKERFMGSLEHISLNFKLFGFDDTQLARTVKQHVQLQLSPTYMPSLTSLGIQDRYKVFQDLLWPVLHQLTALTMDLLDSPSPELAGALAHCRQLQQLHLSATSRIGYAGMALAYGTDASLLLKNVSTFLQHVPHVTELCLQLPLTDAVMEKIQAWTNLETVTFQHLGNLSKDYSTDARYNWRQLRSLGSCNSDVRKLPLHSLDSPVECSVFHIKLSASHAADVAAVKSAAPQLIKCGGIQVPGSQGRAIQLSNTWNAAALNKEQATGLLTAWAPCFSNTPGVATLADRRLLDQCVAELCAAAAHQQHLLRQAEEDEEDEDEDEDHEGWGDAYGYGYDELDDQEIAEIYGVDYHDYHAGLFNIFV